MDYTKFIDSKDIREFNKGTYFSPAEIAVIISLSNGLQLLLGILALGK